MKDCHDLIIVGAGGVGLAAAMYAARLNLNTLVFGASSGSELPVGGVITLTDTVENYPGFIKLTGTELVKHLEKHALSYPQVKIKEEKVLEITKEENHFHIKTDEGEHNAFAVLLATGAKWRELPMKGADEFKNRGVHYCALCDGPLYKGKPVAVIGGSDSAAKEALFLAEHASHVYIIYRGDKIRPEPHNGKLIDQKENITIINKTNVTEILGDKMVGKVKLDNPHEGKEELDVNGVFGAIGHIPLSDLGPPLGVELNEKKEIKINRDAETNVAGVFAAGDVVDSGFKQLITGVAEGVIAAHSAFQYIKKNEFVCTHDDEYQED